MRIDISLFKIDVIIVITKLITVRIISTEKAKKCPIIKPKYTETINRRISIFVDRK
jgi:hypothetical protein